MSLHKSETISLKGKDIYYEVYGAGQPLIMLHGYGMSSKYWRPYVSDFEKDYEVYLIDLMGHGKSSQFEEQLSIKAVAENLLRLMHHLQLKKVRAIGFSYGGDVLFQLALMKPLLLDSMIAIGSLGTWNVSDHPELKEYFTYENLSDFPWVKTHQNSDRQIRSIFEQFQNYDVVLSDDELKNIQNKVLLITGDQDAATPIEEISRVRKNLRQSELCVLPNTAHGAHEGENKALFIRISKSFLERT